MAKCINSEKSKTGCKNLRISPDGMQFAYSNKDDDIITFFDMRNFSQLKSIQFKDKINDFEYEKTNNYFLVASSKGTLMLYETAKMDSNPMAAIDVSNNSLSAVKIDNYNNIFATGGEDALILLWNLEEMMCYKQIKKSDVPIRKLAFNHDSKLISAIYEGPNLDIFDLNTEECVYSVYTENQLYSQVWNPKSNTFAFSGVDKLRNSQEEGGIYIISI